MSFHIEEICEILQKTDRRCKMNALRSLQQQCENSKTDVIQKIFDDCYLHLLKCYSDRFESVRSESVQTVNSFLDCLPPNDFHLLNIVATLVERLGQQETLEESEEIRLLFVQQLLKLEQRFVDTGYKRSLQECQSDITRILNKVLRDPYPCVQREACSCVILLASAANPYTFQQCAEVLAKPLYGLLYHKHSLSRIATVKALGSVALHINSSDDALSRLLMEVSPLLMDSMPLVRRECGELGVRLLLDLRDRYSYFERIIPLVLCCLKDDSPEVREYIEPLWIKCGQQYYNENEAELSKQEIADVPSPNYPINVKRPTIGCRGIVQRSLRVLKLIVRESTDWKENVRLHSLKLLYQFVLHAEATMTAKFFEIYSDVARACRDADSVVVHEAFKVSDLMGRLLKYEDWYEHGFEGLERNAKEGFLKCFYYMFTPALGVKFDDNLRLSELLIQPEFSQTLKSEFQLYVLKTVETILDKTDNMDASILTMDDANKHFNDLHNNCYVAVIKVMSLSLETEQSNNVDLQSKGSTILIRIAKRSNMSLDDLHEQYFLNALNYISDIDSALDAYSEPILLFYGFIKLVKFREPYLLEIQEKINIVFKYCADESKVKIFSAVAIAMLDWHQTINRPLAKSCTLLKDFITFVVEPHLEWHAGANAEAMRSLATATLSSLSQGAAEEATYVLPAFAKYFSALMEDHSTATRHYAVKCLNNFGAVNIENLKPIAYGCLQRLDDPCSGIRLLAISVIPQLEPKFSDQHEEHNNKSFEYDVWESFVKRCMDLLFLHYDGPEIKVRATIKETILKMFEQYPDICKNSYEQTLVTTHNCFSLQELKAELPFVD